MKIIILLCFASVAVADAGIFAKIKNFFNGDSYTDADPSRGNGGGIGGSNFFECCFVSENFDFIIVGAGSAGAVIANRLSANPKWNVLLLEAGGDPTIMSRVPLIAPLLQFTQNDWKYFTEPEENTCRGYFENRCRVVRGKALGGSSQVNYMIYSRGHPRDYDGWARLGNDGWSFQEVLKYFIKSEGTVMKRDIDPEFHGRKGLQTTSFAQWTPNAVIKAFLKSWELLGFKKVDYNSDVQIGYSEMQTITKNGERADVVTEFLEPFRNRTNLVVLKNSHVTKILFGENKTAYGVEYVRRAKKYKATASKEVIVSAGAINSPQLLLLSGIGLAEDLKEFGIKQIANLSVGNNYHDHIIYPGAIYKHASLSSLPLNPFEFFRWLFTRRGSWATSAGIPALAFTNVQNPGSDYPDAEYPIILFTLSQLFFLVYPKPIYLLYYIKHILSPSFTFLTTIMKPKSRGYVKLRSGDPFAQPLIKGNYLSHPDDMDTLVKMMEYSHKIVESEPMRRIGVQVVKEKLPDCTSYDYGTYEYFVCAARHTATNYYHPAGTCKMGPRNDSEAVVDPKLLVYGVKNLRVADASIIPFLPNCHTHAVALMIGEKASDLIKERWL